MRWQSHSEPTRHVGGGEAIDFLSSAANGPKAGHPTLILLDLNLPRKDGRQVLGLLKSQDEFRRIPAIILSSSDSDRDVTSCYSLGANCYMVKPIDLQAYRELVRTLEGFWLGAAKLPQHEGHSIATGIGYAN